MAGIGHHLPDLAPGTYNVRMRDALNPACLIILDPALVITQPAQLAGTVGNTNVTCFGANDGTITITNPTGGYGTYEYYNKRWRYMAVIRQLHSSGTRILQCSDAGCCSYYLCHDP